VLFSLLPLQQNLFAQCDGVNAEDLLTSQLDELARGMRRELRKECDLATCSYDVESGSSLKIREDSRFKVDAVSRTVSCSLTTSLASVIAFCRTCD